MSRPTCQECRFWEPKGAGLGFCRKHAPKPADGMVARYELNEPVPDIVAYRPALPVMDAGDWCGEWQSKDNKQ